MRNQYILRFGGAALLAAGLGFAQPATEQTAPPEQSTPQMSKPEGGFSHEAFHERMMTELNLTADQRTRAQGIWDRERRDSEPLIREFRQNRQDLAAAIKADDTTKIRQLSMQRGHLVGEMTALRSESKAKFYNMLTPDQKTKADQMQARFEERMRERWRGRTGTEE
jgi:Spy/CpxP family protein refolding chaperone